MTHRLSLRSPRQYCPPLSSTIYQRRSSRSTDSVESLSKLVPFRSLGISSSSPPSLCRNTNYLPLSTSANERSRGESHGGNEPKRSMHVYRSFVRSFRFATRCPSIPRRNGAHVRVVAEKTQDRWKEGRFAGKFSITRLNALNEQNANAPRISRLYPRFFSFTSPALPAREKLSPSEQ